jgi:hypothetical protein
MKQSTQQQLPFETMDDFLARLPEAEQQRHHEGAIQIAEEIRKNRLSKMNDPMLMHWSLFDPGNQYEEIHWLVSLEKNLLMICTPYPMAAHLPQILALMIKEDKQFRRAGIEMPEEIIASFNIHLCCDLTQGKNWFESRLCQ